MIRAVLFLMAIMCSAAEPHWALVSPKRPAAKSIDELIAAKLKNDNLVMVPEADRRTLIRRLSFDITGLPPKPDEVDTFLADTSPNAYEKLVDRLLASPHFGERWAQHWLDVVRFAESNGYELDGERVHAWRYRDYVIRSFNDDKPYDRFVLEQLAGDELAADADPRKVAELWIATGMHRTGPAHVVGGNTDREMIRYERLTETLTGFSSAFLGLTLQCARCHDHKFDPISQKDYFSLEAFFAATVEREIDIADSAEKRRFHAEYDGLQEQIEPLKMEIEDLEKPYRMKLAKAKRAALPEALAMALAIPVKDRTAEQAALAKDAGILLKVTWDELISSLSDADRARRERLRGTLFGLEARLPPPSPKAFAIRNDKVSPKTHVLRRGALTNKREVVTPAVPELFATKAKLESRQDLAKWLTTPDHPLTGRVIVNRLWQHYFGRGIVSTPNDFGTHGEPPTHPELLDWLATELTKPSDKATPWSLKRIHKMIVMSQTYRQANHANLGRVNRKRLDGEVLRDAILTASGSLNHATYGRSVKVPLEPEVYELIFTEGEPDNLWPVTPDVKQHTRRSIYLFRKRNVRQPILEAFDQPDTLTPCGLRSTSTFAPQALILMNGKLSREQSKILAERVANEAKPVDEIYRRCLSRLPTKEEVSIADRFLKDGTLAEFALAIFNTNEFVTIP